MIKMLLASLICLALFSGCAHPYKITLTNGNVLTTTSKPKLDPASGCYSYKDALGRPASMPAFRIKEIEPQ